jgi:hypothetical protein
MPAKARIHDLGRRKKSWMLGLAFGLPHTVLSWNSLSPVLHLISM